MPDEIENQVRELVARAQRMPESTAKRATFDEAIRLADAHRRDQLGYDARMAGLWSVYENGDIRLLFAHYAWCLAAADRNPDWDRFDLLWRYRWVIDSMPDTPHISRPQIDDALADMTRRYTADGYTQRAVCVLKRRVYEYMGEPAKEEEAYNQIRTQRRDAMSDSTNAESTFAVDHLMFQKRYADAAKMAETVLAKLPPNDHYAGALRSDMLLPLLTLGETERAARYHRAGMRTNLSLSRDFLAFCGHFTYLTLVGDLPAAVEMAEKHLPASVAKPSLLPRFEFFQIVQVLCDRLLRAGGVATLRVPPLEGLTATDGPIAVAELNPYLDGELARIADLLDDRNGNEYYRQALATDRPTWNALADHLAATAVPVSPPPPPRPPTVRPDRERNQRRG